MVRIDDVPLRRTIAPLVLYTAFLAILACGSGKPSSGDAEQALRARIDNGSDQRLRLKSFQKVDGQAAEAMGVKLYTLMFTADAEFVSNATFSAGAPLIAEGDHIETGPYNPPSRGFSWNDFLAGSQGFHPAMSGDRLHLTGRVSFEKRESGWNVTGVSLAYSLDSSGRGQVVPAGQPKGNGVNPAASQSLNATSVSARRCADYAAAHALPKPSFFDRLRGRRASYLATMPDSDVLVVNASSRRQIWGRAQREEHVGPVAFLPTSEICLGASSLLTVTDIWKDPRDAFLLLSRPIGKGYRVLSFGDVDKGAVSAWIIHPDSTRPLTADLIGKSQVNFGPPDTTNGWSPDGRFVVFNAGNWVQRGFVVANLRDGSSHYISALGFLPAPAKNNCWAVNIAMDSARWSASDVFHVPISYHYVSEGGENPEAACPRPWEMSATLAVDLSRYSASRLR